MNIQITAEDGYDDDGEDVPCRWVRNFFSHGGAAAGVHSSIYLSLRMVIVAQFMTVLRRKSGIRRLRSHGHLQTLRKYVLA